MPSAVAGAVIVWILVLLIPLVIAVLAYPYIALRLRDSREEHKDPQLGIKTVYYVFLSTAVFLILFGATLSAVDLLDGAFQVHQERNERPKIGPPGQPGIVVRDRGDENNEIKRRMQRVAWGLIVSGVLFTLFLTIMIKSGTNDAQFPAPRRAFVGGRLAFSGMVVMLAVTAFIVLLFQKDGGDEGASIKPIYEALTGVLMVWLPAFLIHLMLMSAYSSAPIAQPIAARAVDRDLD